MICIRTASLTWSMIICSEGIPLQTGLGHCISLCSTMWASWTVMPQTEPSVCSKLLWKMVVCRMFYQWSAIWTRTESGFLSHFQLSEHILSSAPLAHVSLIKRDALDTRTTQCKWGEEVWKGQCCRHVGEEAKGCCRRQRLVLAVFEQAVFRRVSTTNRAASYFILHLLTVFGPP